jgi:tetratricopeptide (TPR) repeat protein
VIMACLDRLAGEPKRAIQTASVIGREFTVRLLERTAELQGRIEEYLRELKAAELIYERSLYPELAYMFKHALTHDVAYNSLLLARRKVLHRLVGDAIEALYADRLVEHYETLAYHYERAEAWTKAIDYLRKSGEKALAARAYPEALASFQRAWQAKGEGQDDLQTAALLWGLGRSQAALYDFRAAVGNISRAFDLSVANHDLAGAIAVVQYPWPPVPSLLGGVAELIEKALPLVPEDSLDAARMLIPYATALYMTKFDYDAAQRAFMRAEELAFRHGDRLLQVRVLAAAAGVDMYAARFAQGGKRGLRALKLAQQEGDLLGIAASSWAAGACLLYGGDLEQAERCIQAGIEPAERLKGRTHLARLYLHAASIAWLRGDLGAARGFCERGLAAAPRESRLVSCLAVIEGAAGNLGQAYAYVDCLLAAWMEAGAADLNMASNGVRAGMLLALITQDEDRAGIYAHVASQVLAAPDAPELYRWFMRTALGVSAVVRCDLAAASEHYLQLRAAAAGLCAWFWTGDRVLGLLARTMADMRAAASHFEDALAFCRRGGYRPEYAWTCLDYAELLLAVGGRWSGTGHGGWAAIPLSQASASQDAGETQAVGDARSEDQARARVLLNEGLQIAQELGLRPLQERILSHNELLQA